MQVLPALGDIPSEARLNLVIHHLRGGRIEEAEALMKDINPTTPHEYILKVWLDCGHAGTVPGDLRVATAAAAVQNGVYPYSTWTSCCQLCRLAQMWPAEG